MSRRTWKIARCAAGRSSSRSSAISAGHWWRCRCVAWTEVHSRGISMIGSQLRAVGLALTLFMTLAACSRPASVAPAAGNAPPQPDPWPQFSVRFLEAYFKAEPKFAVEAGRHEFDGQMPGWSAPGIAAQVALLRQLRAEAAALSDAQLSAPE